MTVSLNKESCVLESRCSSHKEVSSTACDALSALTASAMVLPGMVLPTMVLSSVAGESHAATAPDKTMLSYRYSDYQEHDLKSSQVFANAVERYEIGIHQLRLQTSVDEKWGVEVNWQHETMSGASPWFSEENADGEIRQVMSGASIEDERTDASVGITHYGDKTVLSSSLAFSKEDDYQSSSVSVGVEQDFRQGLNTLGGGLSFSTDDLEPTQGNNVTNTIKDDKKTWSAYVNLSSVINEMSLFRMGLSWERSTGFLTDPYKWQDRRPDIRSRYTVNTGYRRFLPVTDGALHVDYRYYWDSWNLSSHTFSFSLYQPITDTVQVIPALRFYSQHQAEFFSTTLDDDVAFQATDYRLSTYGSYSFGVTGKMKVDEWMLTLHLEAYRSDDDSGLYDSDQTVPGLLDYVRSTFGVDYTF